MEKFWTQTTQRFDPESRRRLANAVTNGLAEFRRHLTKLNWAAPHYTLLLEGDAPLRPIRFRLRLERRCAPWDFIGGEAPHTETSSFTYAFNEMPNVTLKAQVWRAYRGEHRLEIEAFRESAQAQWHPPSHAAAYRRLRDRFFEKESAAAVLAGGTRLHAGELWGIKDIHRSEADGVTTLRISTTRILFEDYLFLRRHIDVLFTGPRKEGTFREWLNFHGSSEDHFCPPRDALCVSVALVSPGTDPILYIGKQRVSGAVGRWELSAAGAASSSQIVQEERKPDLHLQVQTVALRETGLRFEAQGVQWLGFARSIKSGDSSVIALVELDKTQTQVQRAFDRRRETGDLLELVPVKLSQLAQWLQGIPSAERGSLFEVGLALVAARYEQAKIF